MDVAPRRPVLAGPAVRTERHRRLTGGRTWPPRGAGSAPEQIVVVPDVRARPAPRQRRCWNGSGRSAPDFPAVPRTGSGPRLAAPFLALRRCDGCCWLMRGAPVANCPVAASSGHSRWTPSRLPHPPATARSRRRIDQARLSVRQKIRAHSSFPPHGSQPSQARKPGQGQTVVFGY